MYYGEVATAVDPGAFGGLAKASGLTVRQCVLLAERGRLIDAVRCVEARRASTHGVEAANASRLRLVEMRGRPPWAVLLEQ
jgi:hypothetical protein